MTMSSELAKRLAVLVAERESHSFETLLEKATGLFKEFRVSSEFEAEMRLAWVEEKGRVSTINPGPSESDDHWLVLGV